MVRPSSRYQPPTGVETIHGEVLDRAFLERTVRGHPTVISCLGLRRAGLLPWAPLRSPPDLVQTVMGHLVEIVPSTARVLWISAAGVSESSQRLTPAVRHLITLGNVGVAYADLAAAERRVRAARRRWLTVRPVTLTPGGPTGAAGPVESFGMWSFVRRADVAEWMLDVADGTRLLDDEAVLLGSGFSRPTPGAPPAQPTER